MKSSKATGIVLVCILFISLATPILGGCGYCGKPPKHKPGKGEHSKPPGTVGTVPPGVTVPTVPSMSPPSRKPCPPSPGEGGPTCPADTLKLGACVDLLGGLVHIGLGDAIKHQCCPILQGLVDIEAAVCLCTTLKIKLLNINLYVPLALQLLLTCGKAPPPGFTCTL